MEGSGVRKVGSCAGRSGSCFMTERQEREMHRQSPICTIRALVLYSFIYSHRLGFGVGLVKCSTKFVIYFNN